MIDRNHDTKLQRVAYALRVAVGYATIFVKAACRVLVQLYRLLAHVVRWLRQLRSPADPEPLDPPTEKQLRYAHVLKVTVPANADKWEVSRLLTEAKLRNATPYVPGEDPELDEQIRQEEEEDQRLEEEDRQREQAERPWQEYGNANKFMLVVFSRGKSTVAEIVQVNGAYHTDRGKLKIETEAMKIVKDRDLGPLVMPGRYIAISLEKIQWHEIIDEIDMHEVDKFKKMHARVKSHI